MISVPAKNDMRMAMRTQLGAMSQDDIATKSKLILQALTRDDSWLPKGGTVALFGGIQGEPDLLPMIPWLLARDATPVFFGFNHGQLIPQVVRDAATLERGIFGVWIPPATAPVLPFAALDVILTPGLAFGRDGMRLGRGRGHFDRLFARPDVKAKRIGICFEFQRVEAVPTELHDAPMDAVITEQSSHLALRDEQ